MTTPAKDRSPVSPTFTLLFMLTFGLDFPQKNKGSIHRSKEACQPLLNQTKNRHCSSELLSSGNNRRTPLKDWERKRVTETEGIQQQMHQHSLDGQHALCQNLFNHPHVFIFTGPDRIHNHKYSFVCQMRTFVSLTALFLCTAVF